MSTLIDVEKIFLEDTKCNDNMCHHRHIVYAGPLVKHMKYSTRLRLVEHFIYFTPGPVCTESDEASQGAAGGDEGREKEER